MREIPVPQKLQIPEDYKSLLNCLIELIEEQKIRSLTLLAGTYARQKLSKQLSDDLSSVVSDLQYIEGCDSIDQTHDWILAVGGGKFLDQAKIVAKNHNAHLIAMPTQVSHDGICSPVAVINGKSMGAVMPEALIVPLFIIEKNELQMIQAGIGDLVANLSAIEDWKLAKARKQEKIDDFAIMLSRRAAMNVLQHLEADLKEETNPKKIIYTKNFLKSLIESLALSGIAMSISGNSRPCSGAEHMISHAIDEIYGAGTKASHGIQVMIATVYLEQLRGYDLLDNLYNPNSVNLKKSSFNSRLKKILTKLGLPTSFEEININEEELKTIMSLAPKTRPGRFTFLDMGK